MKIAIIGTRGIPNNYGGFEQFAEYLAVDLVKKGHQVVVYNSHYHTYQKSDYHGVDIVHCYDPESYLGLAGQFIYDFNCIVNTHSRNFDIIVQLGYTTNSVWGFLLPRKPVIVTNMDGVEWKRSKYPPLVRWFLRHAERFAVQSSDYLVADSVGIKSHITELYQKSSTYIPYGSYVFEQPDPQVLDSFSLMPYKYNMLMARLQSDNSIDVILSGIAKAKSKMPFIVVGNHNTKYGRFLVAKYKNHDNIRFVGAIFDIEVLNNLRYFSNMYFHGHTVGGTNPSLLEAMGSNALICAYDNIFNKAILGTDGFYFTDEADITTVADTQQKCDHQAILDANRKKINTVYHWPLVLKQYEELFLNVLQKQNVLSLLPKMTISPAGSKPFFFRASQVPDQLKSE
ncbi:DUF1972 domain-containing protein [Spirosoma radiotolerans]|uniref:DUF1972 domain-containing protein n=1 Tax=Spirosoma radiotolerans TaxID=1379870 RepID=UPI0009E63F3F|nr:DUF1972 domain-containing protein [Spirosoma radiotolerans]